MTIEPSAAVSERSDPSAPVSVSAASSEKQASDASSMSDAKKQDVEVKLNENEQEQTPEQGKQNELSSKQKRQSVNDNGSQSGKGSFPSRPANLLDASISKNAKSATLRKSKRPPTKAHIQSTISVAQVASEPEAEKPIEPAEAPFQSEQVVEEPEMEVGRTSFIVSSAAADASMAAASPEVAAGKSSAVMLAKQLAFGAGAVKLRSTGRKDLVGLQRSRDLDKEAALKAAKLEREEQEPDSLSKVAPVHPDEESREGGGEEEKEREKKEKEEATIIVKETRKNDALPLTSLDANRSSIIEAKESVKAAQSSPAVESQPKAKASPLLSNSPTPLEANDEKPAVVPPPSRVKSPSISMEHSDSPSKALARILHPGKTSSLESNEPSSSAIVAPLASTEQSEANQAQTSSVPPPETASSVPPVSSPPSSVLPNTTERPAPVVATESPFDPATAVVSASNGFSIATCLPTCGSWFKFGGNKSKQQAGAKSPDRVVAVSSSSNESEGSNANLNLNPSPAMATLAATTTAPIAVEASHA